MIASRSVQAGSQYPCYLAVHGTSLGKKKEKTGGALRKKQISYVGVVADTVPRKIPDPDLFSIFFLFVILICASRIVCARHARERG